MIDLVIFDLDGVLVDSEWLMARVWSEQLQEHGVDIAPRTLIDRFAGATDMSMADVIREESGAALPADILNRIRTVSRSRLQNDLEAIDGVDAVLAALGHAKCICSNSAPDRIRKSLAVTDLDRHFPEVHLFSAADVERPKPHPDLHLHASRTMAAEPAHAVVIEDSVTGVTAAVSAGMTAIGFTGASHVGDGHEEALLTAGAVAVCGHFSEVPMRLAQLS